MGYYYDINDDLNEYDDCWCMIIIGGRNTGKTYSALNYCRESGEHFVFVKRTNEDVKLLCAGDKTMGVDLSPFKAINRDKGSNIKAFLIDNQQGIGAFWNCDDDGNRVGLPIGYIISLNSVSKVKGFDLSECSICIFDEFIPQPWERVSRSEGEQVLDLYKTISRDREHRGLPALKLICLANATRISNPVMNILEVTDMVASMQSKKISYHFDEERGILIHMLNDNKEFREKEKQSQIYKAMGNTAWGRMAFENDFAYNDFSSVQHTNLKGFAPVCAFQHKNRIAYVYRRDGKYHICESFFKTEKFYDLNKENEQKAFYYDYVIDIRNACIDGKVTYSKYTFYDIIMRYKEFFKL